MPLTQQSFSAPFDEIAAEYDEVFTQSKIGLTQRESVWLELSKSFHSGDRVLEIGCGTGVDACFLANRGVFVVACDSSSQMIAVATRRVQEYGLQRLVQPISVRAEDLASLSMDDVFDGAFSNFGVINCIEDLKPLASILYQRLRPGAQALLCGLGSCCIWEVAWYLSRGQGRKAFRRLRSGNIARIKTGIALRIHYRSVRSLERIFAPEFRLKSVKGIGVLVPPSYVEQWTNRFPKSLALASKVDAVISHVPVLRELADHVLLTFERRAV